MKRLVLLSSLAIALAGCAPAAPPPPTPRPAATGQGLGIPAYSEVQRHNVGDGIVCVTYRDTMWCFDRGQKP